MKLTCHRVTFGKISMRGAARVRTKQNVEAESIKMTLARLPPPPSTRPPVRLSNQSATNEQHELACKTTRRGVPARRVVNPSPCREQIDGSIHFEIRTHESPHFGARNPAERLNSTADSRPGKLESVENATRREARRKA